MPMLYALILLLLVLAVASGVLYTPWLFLVAVLAIILAAGMFRSGPPPRV